MEGGAFLKKIVAIIIVLCLVLVGMFAYWATIGFSSAVDDFSGGPTPGGDAGDDEEVEAYATFEITRHAWFQDAQLKGIISSIEPEVRDYISMDEGRVYETQKLVLSPVPPPDVTILGHVWLMATVTGPNSYSSTWGPSMEVPVTDANTVTNMFEGTLVTGRTYFDVGGSYLITVTFMGRMIGGPDVVLDVESAGFYVRV